MELGLNVPNLKGDFGKIHDEIKREGIQNLIETKPYHKRSHSLLHEERISVRLPHLEPGVNPLLRPQLTPMALKETLGSRKGSQLLPTIDTLSTLKQKHFSTGNEPNPETTFFKTLDRNQTPC